MNEDPLQRDPEILPEALSGLQGALDEQFVDAHEVITVEPDDGMLKDFSVINRYYQLKIYVFRKRDDT